MALNAEALNRHPDNRSAGSPARSGPTVLCHPSIVPMSPKVWLRSRHAKYSMSRAPSFV